MSQQPMDMKPPRINSKPIKDDQRAKGIALAIMVAMIACYCFTKSHDSNLRQLYYRSNIAQGFARELIDVDDNLYAEKYLPETPVYDDNDMDQHGDA